MKLRPVAPGDVLVMGVDTGFANVGFCITRISGPTPSDIEILEIGHFETEKATKMQRVRTADDNFERARLIARNLHAVQKRFPNIRAMTFESMAFGGPGQATTMAKVGMCFGVLASIVELTNMPVIPATPQEIKIALCGVRDASKEDVQAALDALYNDVPMKMLDGIGLAQGKREHPYDALGSIVACWDTDVMRLMRAQVKM